MECVGPLQVRLQRTFDRGGHTTFQKLLHGVVYVLKATLAREGVTKLLCDVIVLVSQHVVQDVTGVHTMKDAGGSLGRHGYVVCFS